MKHEYEIMSNINYVHISLEIFMLFIIILQSVSSVSEKISIVWAIGNIGSEESVKVLRPIVLGETEKNPIIRSTAAHGLSHWRHPSIRRSEVCVSIFPYFYV